MTRKQSADRLERRVQSGCQRGRVLPIALLLSGSGLCSLVYQVTWFRELRHIFGASTLASAAVLAIFMAGLGLGSLVLGARADRHPNPLRYYAHLELGIAFSAAASPLLLALVRLAYEALGGSVVLGPGLGTAVRLVLAAVVLGLPTFLMGGTLPAASRAVESRDDAGRRSVGWLYGANTLGAVVGAVASTFVLLEIFGVRITLWLACCTNVFVALLARGRARSTRDTHHDSASETTDEGQGAAACAPGAARTPTPLVLGAAGLVGFVFFLLEMVWYRMLAPVLGGSSYTFGLILAVALFGIGVGGALYGAASRNRPATLHAFALTCALEALFVALPYGAGDRIAVLAVLLRPLASVGFHLNVLSWAMVTSVVVLPAAIVAGYQFPLLIGLLGDARGRVARHVGMAYASNTAGAILGSLAGGFGLLPLLSAPGAWRLAAAILLAVGIAAAAFALVKERGPIGLALTGTAVVATCCLLGLRGPSAAWRHNPIGAGRADRVAQAPTKNGIEEWIRISRRAIRWDADGLESGVALSHGAGYAFVVNGKSDGHATADAPTQVLGGLIGAMLHPDPKRALVVGLGTGSTAGWLAAVPSMERVDVVELEPAILHVARECAPVNRGALDNPRVRVVIGDAREVLLTTPERYDIVFSEPSNPYRAGISSLFTAEFYRASASRLSKGGMFLQWLQSYEIDAVSLRSTFATLRSVFAHVETWQTLAGDLILLGTDEPPSFDAGALRRRVAEEPYRSALLAAWRVTDLEGVLAHHLAGDALARAMASEHPVPNTDDLNVLEFAFARSVGKGALFDAEELWALSRSRGWDRPAVQGDVDWDLVEEHRLVDATAAPAPASSDVAARLEAARIHASGDLAGALDSWRTQSSEPRTFAQLEMLAEVLAEAGDDSAPDYIDRLRLVQPVEADAIDARFFRSKGQILEATEALERALVGYRTDPWPNGTLMERALSLGGELAAVHGPWAFRFRALLAEPFAVELLRPTRLSAFVDMSFRLDFDGFCREALQAFEPDVPWHEEFLARRAACYERTGDGRRVEAKADHDAFLESVPPRLFRESPGARPDDALALERH